MRINRYIATASGMSRRQADACIISEKVLVNDQKPTSGQDIKLTDIVTLNGQLLNLPKNTTTIIFNKPVGYVVSRRKQGSPTIYDLLPENWQRLKPVGRIDKDSSGLLLLTDDGSLSNNLTHPRYEKIKIYEVKLNKPLQPWHQQIISDRGVELEDGLSKFLIDQVDQTKKINKLSNQSIPIALNLTSNLPLYRIHMREGRNRQIRRTFSTLGYSVIQLHRTQFGSYSLGDIKPGSWEILK